MVEIIIRITIAVILASIVFVYQKQPVFEVFSLRSDVWECTEEREGELIFLNRPTICTRYERILR